MEVLKQYIYLKFAQYEYSKLLNRFTVQTQDRRRKMWRLIRISTICIGRWVFLLKTKYKYKKNIIKQDIT